MNAVFVNILEFSFNRPFWLIFIAWRTEALLNWYTNKSGIFDPWINTRQDSSIGKAGNCKHKWALQSKGSRFKPC